MSCDLSSLTTGNCSLGAPRGPASPSRGPCGCRPLSGSVRADGGRAGPSAGRSGGDGTPTGGMAACPGTLRGFEHPRDVRGSQEGATAVTHHGGQRGPRRAGGLCGGGCPSLWPPCPPRAPAPRRGGICPRRPRRNEAEHAGRSKRRRHGASSGPVAARTPRGRAASGWRPRGSEARAPPQPAGGRVALCFLPVPSGKRAEAPGEQTLLSAGDPESPSAGISLPHPDEAFQCAPRLRPVPSRPAEREPHEDLPATSGQRPAPLPRGHLW